MRPAARRSPAARRPIRPSRLHPGGARRLIEGGGERAELELVAGQIATLLEQGVAAEEIAVLVRAAGTSTDLLEEVFSSAGIPFTPLRGRRFADAAIGRAPVGP